MTPPTPPEPKIAWCISTLCTERRSALRGFSVRPLRHWDALLPWGILHVWHEDTVDDLEQSVRRMLEFWGLELKRACLEFYQSDRSVVTANSQQVRQPIFREGLNQWKNYEPWLNPLKDYLGDVLVGYRE